MDAAKIHFFSEFRKRLRLFFHIHTKKLLLEVVQARGLSFISAEGRRTLNSMERACLQQQCRGRG